MKFFKGIFRKADNKEEDYDKSFLLYEVMDFTSVYIGIALIILGGISFYFEGLGELFLIPAAICALCLSFADFLALKPKKKQYDIKIHQFLMFSAIASLVLIGPVVYEFSAVAKYLSEYEKSFTFIALGLTIGSLAIRSLNRNINYHSEKINKLIEINSDLINKIERYETLFQELEKKSKDEV